jgi:hypothetical protein
MGTSEPTRSGSEPQPELPRRFEPDSPTTSSPDASLRLRLLAGVLALCAGAAAVVIAVLLVRATL